MKPLRRRDVLRTLLTLPALALLGCGVRPTLSARGQADPLAQLERDHGGRLGVCVLDTGSGEQLQWRGDERFALCSTFKLPLAATVSRAVEAGELDGEAGIGFGPQDLVPHAPVIQARLDAGIDSMTAIELAEATQLTSDNVAANLLIAALGGPSAVTASWRALGDPVTRLDRFEPAMNHVVPGELRDTTTPCAMARHVAVLLGDAHLSAAARTRLRGWLIATDTGLRRLRAGLPAHWPAGDKTGTALIEGLGNKLNDVAVAWPPGRAPLVIACYYEAPGHDRAAWRDQESIHAEVGTLAARWAGHEG